MRRHATIPMSMFIPASLGQLSLMLVVFAALMPGCDERSAHDDLLVLAAASTSSAVAEVVETFGKPVRVSTGGTNALGTQIVAGAPAHIFLSANEAWVEELALEGLVSDRRALLSNTLVIVTPRGNPADVHVPADLARVARVAIAGEHTPAGIYARQALGDAYESLSVALGQDVRLTLGYVHRGEAEAGVVYATDLRASDRVEVVYTFPPTTHEPIVYSLVLLATEHPDARALFEHLSSDTARAVFEKHGFLRAPP